MVVVNNPRAGRSTVAALAAAFLLLSPAFMYLWWCSAATTKSTLIDLQLGGSSSNSSTGKYSSVARASLISHGKEKEESRKPPSTPAERYLAFGAHWGQSNQLLALEHAMVLAKALNRTLVVPDILTHSNTGRYRYSALFDLDGLRHDIPEPTMVEWHDFAKLNLLPTELIRTKKMFNTDIEGYWESLGWGDVPLKNATHLVLDRDLTPLIEEYRHYDLPVLAFTSLFVYDDHLRDPEYITRMHSIVKLSTPFEAVVRRTVVAVREQVRRRAEAAGLPSSSSWTCTHIRRGDFYDHCLLTFAFDIQKMYNVKWANHSSCYPSLAVVVYNLEKYGLINGVVYVATDNSTILKSPELSKHHVMSLGDVMPSLDEEGLREMMEKEGIPKGDVFAAVDQAVCSSADNLLINDFSTYSGGY